MSTNWSLVPPATPSESLLASVDGAPILAQLLAQRGFDRPESAGAFLDPARYQPAAPTDLVGIACGAELIHNAISKEQNILVWGDFDVDGQTSTSLLVAALRDLAAPGTVHFHVPNRFSEGHGIKTEVLHKLVTNSDFVPQLLLTCDTGIAEGDSVGYAKDNGLCVVVTDHHALPEELQSAVEHDQPIWGQPVASVGRHSVRRADAIINPQFQSPDHPLRSLPGVGVAYLLIQEIFARAGHAGDAQAYLDLVALGIVADVAEQVRDTRYLLQRGLAQLRSTRRTGLLALMDVARVVPATVSAEDIAFQLGPRMNALGRLDDATIAVELLTTSDPIRAGQLAGRMERLNQQRRLLTSQITATALEMLDRNPSYLEFNAIVLAHPAWHAGIVGIVAARLAEQFHKPTVLLLNPAGAPARGSARSVAGIDIGAAIAGCSHLLLGHGGHPGAAGVQLLPEDIDRFRRELDRQVALHMTAERLPALALDLELPLTKADLATTQEIDRLAPFGSGNSVPNLLARNLSLKSDRRFGRSGDHRRLEVVDASGQGRTVLWFNAGDTDALAGPFDLAYQLTLNYYRGQVEPQLLYVDSRPVQTRTIELDQDQVQVRSVVDLRAEVVDSGRLPSPATSIWYAEGISLDENSEIPYAPRTKIAAGTRKDVLVVWSIPPSVENFVWLCEITQATTIYLCGEASTQDTYADVVRSVAAMCKFALNRDRTLHLTRMAARLGLTKIAIRYSLSWLQHCGEISIIDWGSDEVATIAPGTGLKDRDALVWSEARLKEQLAEIRAYRRYFLRARLSELGIGPIRSIDIPQP